MKNILFACVHNSGRSKRAEAKFNKMAQGCIRAQSAGTQPSDEVNSNVVKVMSELGLDLSQSLPTSLTPEMLDTADLVITMGCNIEDACPAGFISARDWHLDDPKDQSLDKVRLIRDEICSRIEDLMLELNISSC